MNKYFSILLIFFSISIVNGYSQGIKGFVNNTNYEPMEFATIYVKELGTGSSTNIEGYFQMYLNPGTYNLVFQHLGFKAKELKVTIGTTFSELKILMEPETIVLKSVVVTANNEDPAYTIMRKAISKAKYHKQQLNSFEAEVYIKGSGRLLDSPFFLRKTIEKEGIDSTSSFTSESVSLIKYLRPNTYEEKVISIRSKGEDYGTNPNSFILGSLYDPKYVDAISPLSPKAFGYYKFEYLGTKLERGYEISKIRVTPRSRGDGVFWGIISIVEDEWSIQSTNLYMQNVGILFNIRQIYEPIETIAWLPISHKFDVTGKFFGFKFEYQYLSTMGKYTIELNQDLAPKFEIVDENIEKELAKELDNKPSEEIENSLSQGGEVTRKQFRKLIKEYEKEEKNRIDEPLVESNFTYTVDSTAKNSDSLYWSRIRPVPLTEYEVKGYHKMDSATVAEQKEAEGDTLETNKHDGFRFYDVLLGYNFKLGDNDRLKYYAPWQFVNFNTVEGYNFVVKFKYSHTFSNKSKLFIWPQAKYGFSSTKLYGKVNTEFRYGPIYRRSNIRLNGGFYSKQLNNENPIHPLVNTITTLLFHENFLKLYESSFISASNNGYISERLGYNIGINLENRSPLQNTTDHGWFNTSGEYSSNAPSNIESVTTDFIENNSLVYSLGLEYQPWLKYSIRNGKKTAINSSSPTFDLSYRSGVLVASFNGSDFNQLEFGFKHNLSLGIRGQFYIDARAGAFIGSSPSVFVDYKHFSGNETPFLMEDPVGSYRLLPYYLYSTADKYASAQVLYQFRKFLFTQLPMLQLTGVKELAYISYLVTPSSGNYVEVGYGLDNLIRILRVEVSSSFIDGQYSGFGIKIGVAASITSGDGSVSIGF
jgi:ribosomal protein L19